MPTLSLFRAQPDHTGVAAEALIKGENWKSSVLCCPGQHQVISEVAPGLETVQGIDHVVDIDDNHPTRADQPSQQSVALAAFEPIAT